MSSEEKKEISILILEDNPQDIALYKRRFARQSTEYDFHVDSVSTIADAIDMTKTKQHDCYVVDYRLPDGEGMDFIHHLNSVNDPSLPCAILMITGQGNEEVAVEAMKSGVHEYLTKKSITEGYFVRPVLNSIQRAQLSSEIAFYQKELERSNKELSDFTHTASHDLKSPLRRIIAYCDMLIEDTAAKLNEDELGILKRMKLNATRMQSLINDLLMFSLIRTEEERPSKVSIGDVIGDVIEELKEQLEENSAQIIYGKLPELYVYPLRIKQLFTNLFSNALKYRSEKDPVIKVSYTQEDGQPAIICVEDNGMGIDKKFHNDIFQEFKRLHNQEDIEGTGLGLPICKKIAEKHHGEIWVESEPGKGSKFCFAIGDINS